MKKFGLFLGLLTILSLAPAAFETPQPVRMSEAQMLQAQGGSKAVWCGIATGVAGGLGVGGLFGCVPCGVAGTIIGLGTMIVC